MCDVVAYKRDAVLSRSLLGLQRLRESRMRSARDFTAGCRMFRWSGLPRMSYDYSHTILSVRYGKTQFLYHTFRLSNH